MHRASDPCVYICKRCNQRMEHPDEAESCEDMECTMWSYEWEAQPANPWRPVSEMPNMLSGKKVPS